MKLTRVACLVIPRFVADVCMRANPSLATRPIAVAEGANRREIVAHNAAAAGVQAGMTPKQARAACPGLVVVARNEAAERSVTCELLDALESCSPHVEGALPGVYFFDASGLPRGEAEALAAAVALVAELGFTVAAAIADDKFTARCAACSGRGCSVVPAGKSAAFLAPLPIGLLPLAPGDADRFDILGLRTLGQIAALPTAPLAARFGERARTYARLAAGLDDTILQPRRTATVYEERFAFDGAVEQLEPLLFALRGCLGNLAGRLSGAAQVCDRVEVILALDAGNNGLHCGNDTAAPAVLQVPVLLAEPTASMSVMFDLARIALEARDDVPAVDALIVRALPCNEPPPQLALFDGSGASRRTALAATLARLRAALDPHDVVRLQPQPEKSRLPERMQRALPIGSPREFEQRPPARTRAAKNGAAKNAAKIPGIFPARHGQAGVPQTWAPALRLLDPPKPMQAPEQHRAYAGPFRLSESWWERPVERDYYQLVDASGALILAYRDLRNDCWYVHGVFD
ncbi:MAG TPA: DNA polymerase Y family protein [Candidatus Eremiobacteraceae bacterium]|nr:DNA polymerase Y family protein [Candidatus Eremiobacteraceae bacterium]